ncbi:hypothetical protein RIF29_09353 [Crotalaria pallida]|uniref:RNase H type-1 domain-containing protein n=1 Tax=Crotalaria pallida TaxID=3830 RepID=A0AAN9ILM4_CROPI
MPGIDPNFICHKLSIIPGSKPVAQRKRKVSAEKAAAIEEKVAELLRAGFIREIDYTDWLANTVLVKKPNGKWRMCVDYTDLNKVCPKDQYPLPVIDKLVDSSAGYKLLSFMDAYSGYNKIPMFPADQDKTAFITDKATYCYNVMPFGLKNAGATYQRMMNKVFQGMIGRNMEVYIDDIIAKSRQGIEANPDKCKAILEMRSPANLKEVQQLTGRVAALSRFLSQAARKALPWYQLLRKNKEFLWDEHYEQAFVQLKEYLSSPPVLHSPLPGENLILYMSVAEAAVSSVLVREDSGIEAPVYFVSRALQGPELRYQKLEKLAYCLVTSARRLRQYFQAHRILVRTAQPLRQVLHKPDLAGRMVSWSVELSEFDITYEPRKAMKSQALADFITEFTDIPSDISQNLWSVYVDGSSNKKGAGAGVIIENPEGLCMEYSLKFEFQTSNNQEEYEAVLAGLKMVHEFGAERVSVFSDSQLVVSQIKGQYSAKEPILQKYLEEPSNCK